MTVGSSSDGMMMSMSKGSSEQLDGKSFAKDGEGVELPPGLADELKKIASEFIAAVSCSSSSSSSSSDDGGSTSDGGGGGGGDDSGGVTVAIQAAAQLIPLY